MSLNFTGFLPVNQRQPAQMNHKQRMIEIYHHQVVVKRGNLRLTTQAYSQTGLILWIYTVALCARELIIKLFY